MLESAALIKKLQIKPGAKLWLINVPEAVAEALTAGAEVETVKAGEACDGVIVFVVFLVVVGFFVFLVGLLFGALRSTNLG